MLVLGFSLVSSWQNTPNLFLVVMFLLGVDVVRQRHYWRKFWVNTEPSRQGIWGRIPDSCKCSQVG